jgi:small subunit ribosomal protein S4
MYGVLERQFRKHFQQAARRPGVTGQNLLQILETRLDNVVYRLGFADSRKQARQLVRHGHFALNGRRTDIPSAAVRAGDAVDVYRTSRDSEYFQMVRDTMTRKNVPRWLQVDPQALGGRVLTLPGREDIESNINEALVVEYYSR